MSTLPQVSKFIIDQAIDMITYCETDNKVLPSTKFHRLAGEQDDHGRHYREAWNILQRERSNMQEQLAVEAIIPLAGDELAVQAAYFVHFGKAFTSSRGVTTAHQA